MAIHSWSHYQRVVTSFTGALTNGTQHGAWVDRTGFRRAGIILDGWTGSATTLNFIIEEADTSGGVGSAAVTGGVTSSSNDLAALTNPVLSAAVLASQALPGPWVIDLDLQKRKQFLRVSVVGTGTAGGADAKIVLAEPLSTPPLQVNDPPFNA